MLGGKNSGGNSISYINRNEKENSPNFWLLNKIESPFGVQNFVTFSSWEEYRNINSEDTQYKLGGRYCYAAIIGPVILDDFGTKKFYCTHPL